MLYLSYRALGSTSGEDAPHETLELLRAEVERCYHELSARDEDRRSEPGRGPGARAGGGPPTITRRVNAARQRLGDLRPPPGDEGTETLRAALILAAEDLGWGSRIAQSEGYGDNAGLQEAFVALLQSARRYLDAAPSPPPETGRR